MTVYVTIVLTIIGVIVIPVLAVIFRAAVRWKGIEDKLEGITDDLKSLVHDKDRVHTEIATQMREDRLATNQRLRWLEENLWNRHDRPHP